MYAKANMDCAEKKEPGVRLAATNSVREFLAARTLSRPSTASEPNAMVTLAITMMLQAGA